MFLVDFELIFLRWKNEKHWSRKQDGDAALKTISFVTTYYVVNTVLGNIWPIKYENRKTSKIV